MKITNDKNVFNQTMRDLNNICNQLEDLNRLLLSQTIHQSYFAGHMAQNYQQYIFQLLKEHQKIIEFYRQLSKEIEDISENYDRIEIVANKKLNEIN